jgi:hypothetical protein
MPQAAARSAAALDMLTGSSWVDEGPLLRVTCRLTEAGRVLDPSLKESGLWAETYLPEGGQCPEQFRKPGYGAERHTGPSHRTARPGADPYPGRGQVTLPVDLDGCHGAVHGDLA